MGLSPGHWFLPLRFMVYSTLLHLRRLGGRSPGDGRHWRGLGLQTFPLGPERITIQASAKLPNRCVSHVAEADPDCESILPILWGCSGPPGSILNVHQCRLVNSA